MRRTCHDPDPNAAVDRANEPFDDDCILITFILEPERFLRPVDDGRDPFASIVGAPKQSRVWVGFEWLARPVGVEALYHFPHFALFGGCNRVIARFSQISGLPVERLNKTYFVVDNHRLLMRESKGSTAVTHFDTGREKGFSGLFIF